MPQISLCGSTNHVRITHKSCPLNPQHTASTSEKASSSQSHETDEEESEFEGFESDGSSYEGLFSDNADSSDDEVVICNCGRAHKRDWLLNPRNKKGNASKPKKQHVWQSRKGQSSSHIRTTTKGKGKAAVAHIRTTRKEKGKAAVAAKRTRAFRSPVKKTKTIQFFRVPVRNPCRPKKLLGDKKTLVNVPPRDQLILRE